MRVNRYLLHVLDIVKTKYPKYNLFDNHGNFIGYNACGPISHTLAQIIKREHPEVKIEPLYYSIGYGRYKEDHICILANKKTIIDPTYRQFFATYLYESNTPYYKKLFVKSEPFFEGDITELECFIRDMKLLDSKNFLPNDLMDIWTKTRKPPYDF